MEETGWVGLAEASNITVEELDALVVDYKTKRDKHADLKKVATDAYHELATAEKTLQEALKAMGKKSYKVDGVGTFTRVMKEVITTPKTIQAKRDLWQWIAQQYDSDVLDDMLSINHAKLNSFYREEAEKEKDNPAFKIPGLDSPTATENVSFRKA